MFDKVFKHEVLFIGYMILACVMSTPWAGLWFSLLALVHGLFMLYYTIKKAPKDFTEKKQ